MGGGPPTDQDLFRAQGGFNRLDELQTLSYCPWLLRPNEPRSFPLPSYALPERTSLRHTLRTSHGTAPSASAISENEIIPVVGIRARTVSAVGILSSPKEESSKSSSLRPKSRIWFRQMMKWLRQCVSRHTDGKRLRPHFGFLYSRHALPARLSRLIGSSSPHPQGHEIKSHRGTPRSTSTASPGERRCRLASVRDSTTFLSCNRWFRLTAPSYRILSLRA